MNNIREIILERRNTFIKSRKTALQIFLKGELGQWDFSVNE